MWEADGNEGLVVAELTDDAGGTVLVIERPGIALDRTWAHGAGWQEHLEDLAAHLAGQEAPDWSKGSSERRPSRLLRSEDSEVGPRHYFGNPKTRSQTDVKFQRISDIPLSPGPRSCCHCSDEVKLSKTRGTAPWHRVRGRGSSTVG